MSAAASCLRRHARARRGHPRLSFGTSASKTWMAGDKPGHDSVEMAQYDRIGSILCAKREETIGSIDLHPGGLCDLRPFLDLGGDEGGKFRRCHRQRHDSLLRPRLLDLGRVEDFSAFGIEAFDDRFWRRVVARDADPT